jgi:hypothetical protein
VTSGLPISRRWGFPSPDGSVRMLSVDIHALPNGTHAAPPALLILRA